MSSVFRLFLRVRLRKDGSSWSRCALFRCALFRDHCSIFYLVVILIVQLIESRKVVEMGVMSVFQKAVLLGDNGGLFFLFISANLQLRDDLKAMDIV